MLITNTHRDPLGLPNGQVLNPRIPTQVLNWDKIRQNLVVAAWVRAGLLVEDGSPTAASSQFVQPDKAELQAKLDALGVPYHKLAGVPKLQALLEAAEADARDAEDSLRKEAQVRALEASGLSAEDWTNQADDVRDAQIEAEYQKLVAEQD